jgi:enoyl-CoA hydratase/carnithine racemase
MSEHSSPHFTVKYEHQVATIWARLSEQLSPAESREAHRIPSALALANLFDSLRADDRIRVIVMHRGGPHHGGHTTKRYESQEWKTHHNDPVNIWRTFSGIIRLHEVMASIEKPIIAQVDGDLIGGGCYIALSADLIVAREDARFGDHHLAMGEFAPIGPPFGLMPGDGGVALAPLYFSPPLAKEWLMLGKSYTAKELAERGVINYAVPAEKIDDVVADLTHRLLERPAYPLAWAKRVANRHVVDQLNRTLDAGAGYEMIGLSQLERQGWIDKKTLD